MAELGVGPSWLQARSMEAVVRTLLDFFVNSSIREWEGSRACLSLGD